MKTLHPIYKIFLLLILVCSHLFANLHSFDLINPISSRYIQGNYAIAGNTVMCLTDHENNYGGTCQDSGYELETSNRKISKYLDIDTNNGTWNSTSSYITFPSSYDPSTDRGVLWAGLFWQGRLSRDNSYPIRYGEENASSTYQLIEIGKGSSRPAITDDYLISAGVKQIKLKIDNGNYNDVNASTLYTYGSDNGRTYAAFSDVTDIVHNAVSSDGNHTFTVANLTTGEGRESSPGLFGGWSLVVIYAEDETGEFRNISVFSGFDKVNNPSDAFTIDNFILPKSGSVNATLSLFSGEGEYRYGYRTGNTNAYDWVKISRDGSSYDYMPGAITDKNIFDAKFTGVQRADISGQYNNLQVNNDGVDVDSYDVSTLMTTYRDENPDMNSMYIQWSSNNDYITPSMLVFATQIYAPRMCYDYSLKQDGRYLNAFREDGNTTRARIDNLISASDIEVTVYLRNEEADLAAHGISMRTDLNTTMFDQTGHVYSSNTNGSTLIDRGAPSTSIPLCDYNNTTDNSTSNNGCTDGHNIRKGLGSLDAQDYVYSKFILNPSHNSGLVDVNETLGLTIDYYLSINGAKITYNGYELGGVHVPLCKPTDAYTPTFGLFNIVQHDQTYNNLFTQISRHPFDVDVIFDSDPSTGTNDAPSAGSDINTTVLVEMIDIDAFGDINASCANPDSVITPNPIFVPLSFNDSDWQNLVPSQSNNYFNFAVKNGAYRIWYFTDTNGSLIQNWSATTTDNGKSLQSISGLYNSSIHTMCSSQCASDDTSVSCFECIYANYARPLCSRDNFSVRPESYDARIYDINNSLSTYDINTDPTNIKNTSKIDLTELYHFTPSHGSSTGRIEMAAGYNYRFDINATGHDGLSPIPGYTRYFNGGSDHNITEIWDPQSTLSGCNDTSDKNMIFFIANGATLNNEYPLNNVGEYRFNIIDTSWTAVDSTLLSHHDTSSDGGFVAGQDCTDASDSTAITPYGCNITTNHGSDGGGRTYKDLDLTFHPYQYSITNNVTLRTGNVTPPTTFKPFVYMANISTDENMSVHLNTTVSAIGRNSTTPLSNYVTGCFAKPMNFEIGKTATNNVALRYSYRVHNKDINGTTVPANDINQTIVAGNTAQNPTFATTSAFFHKNMNGVTQIVTNLNFDRDVNVTANPEDINFTTITVDDNASLFNADLTNNKYAEGNFSVNQRVLYYYGRTIAPKITVICNANTCRTGISATNNNNIKELISYVIFCQGGSCNSSILPTGAQQVADARWFENRNHDRIDGGWLANGTDGTIGPISEVTATGNVNEVAGTRNITANKYETEAVIEYSGPLPYDAIMQMQSSPWLIQNETDANATTNTFIIQFVGDGGWSGKYEDNTTTKTNFSKQTNRRIMW